MALGENGISFKLGNHDCYYGQEIDFFSLPMLGANF